MSIDSIVEQFAPLSLDELRELEGKLQELISDKMVEVGFELEKQLTLLHQIASEKGIKLPRTGPKKTYPARFRNPQPPHQEWSGRGRRPNWIRNFDAQFGDEAKTEEYCAIPLAGLETPEENA